MALNNSKAFNFDEIRLILSANGFYVDGNFEILELGFWSRKCCGIIPFKTSKKFKSLSINDKNSALYYTKFFHGMDYEQKASNALNQNEIISTIKALYNLCGDNTMQKMIGYINDSSIWHYIGSADLGDFVISCITQERQTAQK